ncbi:UDP-N-acetylmuramoyl-L-alanyl-D-glutamate--2,6-diaminopimelate ligase [Corynebacterium riegelii]
MNAVNGATIRNLAQLAHAELVNAPSEDMTVTSISLDSSAVEPGGIFAALPGTRAHGASYAKDSKASALLTDADGLAIIRSTKDPRPVLVVDNVRAVLGQVAAEVYGWPSTSMKLIGVTGTSGKTTTTYMLERGLAAAGCKVGLIGTTGTRIAGDDVPTKLTTPEAPKLQELFARMRDAGVTHVVMEVSSHALMLGRVGGTQFDVAGFTNLSQDHLDFHSTMEEYFEAKALFFDPESPYAAEKSVICVDDQWGVKMAGIAKDPVLVGTRGQDGVDVSAHQESVDATGVQHISLEVRGAPHTLMLPMPGKFNVANAALAVALATEVGVDAEAFIQGLSGASVPGRMEPIDCGQEFVAVVDYAHKPAAIAAVLETLRGQVSGRVGIVVGAGGDRDASKRAVMGAESAKGADLVIVTDDNPRTEDPAAIRAAVLAGAREAGGRAQEIREVAGRAAAIDQLVAWAKPGDAIIAVGKGHEVGQIIGETTHHFDDREEMHRALHARMGASEEMD